MLFYILLVVFAIVAIIILYNQPKYIFPIFLILSPLERFNTYSGFTITPLIVFFPIAIIVFLLLLYKKKIRLQTLYNNKSLLIILFLIYTASLLSVIGALNKLDTIRASFYVLIYVIVIYINYILIINYRNWKLIFRTLVALVTAVSIYAIYQFVAFKLGWATVLPFEHILNSKTLPPGDFTFNIGDNTFIRPNSTFSDVNSTAGFIMIFIPFILFKEKFIGFVNRWLSVFIDSVVVLAFILMYSRGAFLSLLIGLTISFLIYLAKYYIELKSIVIDRNFILALVFVIFICIIFIYLFELNMFNILKVQNVNNFSDRAHIEYIYSGLGLFKHSPVIGNGISSFSKSFYNFYSHIFPDGFISVDNPPLYLKWLAELGIIGFIFNITIFIYILFKLFFKYLIKDKRYDYLLISIGFIAVLADNFVHAYTFLFFFAIYISLICAYLDEFN